MEMKSSYVKKALNNFLHTTSYHHIFRHFGDTHPIEDDRPVFYLLFDKSDNYIRCGIWDNGKYGYDKMKSRMEEGEYIIYGVVDKYISLSYVREFKQQWKKHLLKFIS